MAKRQERGAKYDARRAEIVDIAARLFARNGYAETSIADISDATKLGKGGLYYYIGSKESLLVEIHERVMDPLLRTSKLILDLDTSPPVRLQLLSEDLVVNIMERLDHVWVFLHEHRALKGDLLDAFKARRTAYRETITSVLADGDAQGYFAIEELTLTTMAFLGMHNYTYQWVRPGARLGPRDISRHYCGLFLRGIAGPKLAGVDVEAEVARLRPELLALIEAEPAGA
jgi:AcrR family transcriptional regulator